VLPSLPVIGDSVSGFVLWSGASGSASIYRQFEPVWLALDDAHVRGVDSTNPDNPGEVADIAVVEDQITRGSVVADVSVGPRVGGIQGWSGVFA
jgi:hypothetical protein